MKKSFILFGVATALFAGNAQATEIKPYVSAKFSYSAISSDFSARGYDDYLDDTYTVKLNGDDNIFGGSLAGGVSIPVTSGAFRVEAELHLNSTAKKTQDANINYHYSGSGYIGSYDLEVKTRHALANVYYDIATGTKVTPFIGAGLGIGQIEGKVSSNDWGVSESMKKTKFIWQIGAGVSFAASENVAIDLGYRYIDYGDFSKTVDDGEKWSLDTSANEFYLGVRYGF